MTPSERAEKICSQLLYEETGEQLAIPKKWLEMIAAQIREAVEEERSISHKHHCAEIEVAVDRARAVGHEGCRKEARQEALEEAAKIVEMSSWKENVAEKIRALADKKDK